MGVVRGTGVGEIIGRKCFANTAAIHEHDAEWPNCYVLRTPVFPLDQL